MWEVLEARQERGGSETREPDLIKGALVEQLPVWATAAYTYRET